MNPRLAGMALLVGLGALLAGCGSSTASSTPTSTPTSRASLASVAPTSSVPASIAPASASPASAGPVGSSSSGPNANYTCTTLLPAVSASPSPSAGALELGQLQDDMGRLHVNVGTAVTYQSCPPASGKHYSSSGLGPIAPRFYGPSDATAPQNWGHNLEHGGLVILYSCTQGGCDAPTLDRLRLLVSTLPPSPVCGVPAGVVSPVITRFDEMSTPFAGLVWDRVLLQASLDVPQLLRFYADAGETLNPEGYCAK